MGTPIPSNRNRCSTIGFFPMAQVQAGVVGDVEVNGLPQQPSGMALSLQSPSTWTYLWVGLATLYLVMTYLGMIRISRRGE
jgi:hypothetical protein